jgi:hypothetical protein
MTVSRLLEEISQAGLTLRLTDAGRVNAKPAELITPAIRQLIKSNKVALMSSLETSVTPPCDNLERQLIEAAMRACDWWGDSPAVRAQMMADIRSLHHHQHQGWLEHFLAVYGKTKG